jgi:hypothetical protein
MSATEYQSGGNHADHTVNDTEDVERERRLSCQIIKIQFNYNRMSHQRPK